MNEETETQKTPIAISPRGVVLNTFDEMWRFSVAVSKSGFAPKGIERPEAIMIALQTGFELGLTPMSALQSIAVINGRPGVYGDAALALVRASGLCESYSQTLNGEGDNRFAEVITTRKGQEPLHTRFSVSDAKKAGLWGKPGPWSQYPDRMLLFRARGFNLRDNFGDVLKGFRTTEELEDFKPDYSRDPRVVAELQQNGPEPTQTNTLPSFRPDARIDVPEEQPKRPRGRPRKTDQAPLALESSLLPAVRDTQEAIVVTPEAPTVVVSPAEQTAEVVVSPLVAQLRSELEKIGKNEARLLSIMNDWNFLPNPAANLADVDEATLDLISKRWSQVVKHL